MKLTIVASNRDRFKIDNSASNLFIKSIQWQTYTDFELLVVDSMSKDYEEIKEYLESYSGKIPIRVIQHKTDLFSRSLLNNVGIRNGKGEYVLCTDIDMLFGKDFIKTVMENVGPNILVESRTMYLKDKITRRIYSGELDPYNDLDGIKLGRIKKRSTAGGTQCMHIDSWTKLHGQNELMKVWGSEDFELLTRAKMAGIKVIWLGEKRDNIMLFHQAHPKPNLKRDLEWQEKNKKFLHNIESYVANPEGWGGKK